MAIENFSMTSENVPMASGMSPNSAGSVPIRAETVPAATMPSPMAAPPIPSSPLKLPEGQPSATVVLRRTPSQPQSPRLVPASPRLGEGRTERHPGVIFNSRHSSQDGQLELGAGLRQAGRKPSNAIYRVQSGQELDVISLSFDDMDYDTDSTANLERDVLNDLSEGTSAFYSVLASQSMHSLDDLDAGQRALMGSTDDMLNEGDMEMKQYWMQNRPKRRSPSQSSSAAPSNEGVSTGLRTVCLRVP